MATPTAFEEANITFAKDQKEYIPLPALAFGDEYGQVITCWQMTPEELAQVAKTGKVWLTMLTFNQPLQPVMLHGAEPFQRLPHFTPTTPLVDSDNAPLMIVPTFTAQPEA